MKHVKFRANMQGPPCKAKYSWMTDSETVPWGKGENRSSGGEWKRIWNRKLTICGSVKWPRACWRMSRRLIVGGLVKTKSWSLSESKSE